MTHIPTHGQPPTVASNPNILPPTTYMPTKQFVKAGTNDGKNLQTAGELYDPANSAMKLHHLAKHNNVIEIYEKVRNM